MILSETVDFSFGIKKPGKRAGKVPAVSRMMALAIYYRSLIQDGKIQSVSDIGRLENVSQQRVSQIMSLVWLSPGIQEEILQLPLQKANAKGLHTEKLIEIAREVDFERQEELLNQLLFFPK